MHQTKFNMLSLKLQRNVGFLFCFCFFFNIKNKRSYLRPLLVTFLMGISKLGLEKLSQTLHEFTNSVIFFSIRVLSLTVISEFPKT